MKRNMDEAVSVQIMPTLISYNHPPFTISEQEEETTRLATAKRRLQREIDELTEQNETLTRDLANAKKSLVPNP